MFFKYRMNANNQLCGYSSKSILCSNISYISDAIIGRQDELQMVRCVRKKVKNLVQYIFNNSTNQSTTKLFLGYVKVHIQIKLKY